MICRVSRVSSDSINRLVNIVKHTLDFGTKIYGSQGSNFPSLFFAICFYFMKMISIKFMCN
jgi:hypothetical protein